MEAHHGAFKDIIILVKMAEKSQIHSLVKFLNCISLLINRRRYRVVTMRSEWHIGTLHLIAVPEIQGAELDLDLRNGDG